MDNLKIGVVLAQMINFGILVAIFYFFLGDKITKMIEDRRKMMKETENAEEEAKAKLEQAEKEKQKIIEDARKNATEIEQNAEELAKQNTKKALEKAEKEADYMVDAARNQIEKEQLDMENSMKDKVMNLALQLNSKIFKKSDANKSFIESEYDLITK